MDVFKRALEYIRQMWANLGPGQRVLLGTSAVALFFFLVWGGSLSAGDSMVRVVGGEVGDANRGRIAARLRERNQRFETRNREIHVPKEDADSVIMILAGENLLSEEDVFAYINTTNILDDRGVRDKKYQVAVQKKLEYMVGRIEGIRAARVLLNIVSPSGVMFAGGPRPGASIMVELAAGRRLTQANVEAITGMVARMVPGLESHEVVLADTAGNPYRAAKRRAGDHEAWDLRAQERQIAEAKADALMRMFPGSTAIVDVRLRSKATTKKDVRHGPGVATETETVRRTDKGGAASPPVGIKAAESLDPASLGTAGARRDEVQQESREKVLPDVTTTEETQPAGDIEKISVAMNLPVDAGADGKVDDAAAAKRVSEVKRQVIAAVGAPADDATVQVVAVPRARPEPAPVAASLGDRSMDFLGERWPQIALYVLAGLALVFMIRLVGRAAPRGVVEEIAGLRARIEEPEAPVEELAIAAGETEAARLRSGIRDLTAQNPAGTGAVLNRWMSGK